MVLQYEDADQPDVVEPIQTFIVQVTAIDPDTAGRIAVDHTIMERTGEEMDNEGTVDFDTFRMEYKCIAIYEGHLKNLVK